MASTADTSEEHHGKTGTYEAIRRRVEVLEHSRKGRNLDPSAINYISENLFKRVFVKHVVRCLGQSQPIRSKQMGTRKST